LLMDKKSIARLALLLSRTENSWAACTDSSC
jgi:hypothetical protein